MTAIRVSGRRGMTDMELNPGDTLLLGESLAADATVGAATLGASELVTGFLYRSGSTAAYNDTFDTATNVLAALAGNDWAAALIPGHSFKLRLINSVAFADTITLGAGMVAGSGTVASVAASTWRDFMFTVTSVQQQISVNSSTTNGSKVVTWVLPSGQGSLQEGPNVGSVNIMIGASVSGTGIAANTTVAGITQGLGGTLGITLSANATATNSNVLLTFGPTIRVDGLGSGTL